MKTFTYTTRCKTILGDLHTPVSTYLKVRDIFPQSALMESSDYHGSENNRSFIGLNPVASIGINHGTATATYPDGSMEEHPISEHFRADHTISDFLNRFQGKRRIQQLLRTVWLYHFQCRTLFRTYQCKRQP